MIPHKAFTPWWRLLHDTIGTRQKLHGWNIPEVESPICQICKAAPEDLYHFVVGCPSKRQFWIDALNAFELFAIFPTHQEIWNVLILYKARLAIIWQTQRFSGWVVSLRYFGDTTGNVFWIIKNGARTLQWTFLQLIYFIPHPFLRLFPQFNKVYTLIHKKSHYSLSTLQGNGVTNQPRMQYLLSDVAYWDLERKCLILHPS